MKLSKLLIFILFLNCLLTEDTHGYVVTEVRAPKVLYHWLKFQSLNYMAAEYHKNGTIPLSTIRSDFVVARTIPILNEKKGLFAWSNPVTGMSAAASEIYGRGEALLKLEIDSRNVSRNIKTLKVTVTDPPATSSSIDIARDNINKDTLLDADLILHQIKYGSDDKIYLQEWIILNPNIITRATADPAELKADLEKDIARLKNPKYYYRREALHAPQFSPADNIANYMKHVVLESVTKFLETKENKIPTVFMKKTISPRCQHFYL